MSARSRWAALAWMALPLLLYLLVLRHLWFNAPAWDDYDAMLDSPMMMMDAGSTREWLGKLFAQHNEHRIAFARLVAWSMAKVAGHIDFRVLVLLGDLSWAGILVLMWAEFRETVAPPLFMAAAFVLLQWSYYEASLVAMAALSNVGVVLFSLACLYFAVRERARDAALAIAFGVLAAGTQANGLFALPIAAAGAAFLGRGKRAALFAAVTVALWIPYFWSYSRPGNHPSMLAALQHPLSAVQLFLIVIGGIVPGRWLPIPAGLGVLAALAWLARGGVWKAHPAVALWVLFALASAAAATAGRTGLGVFHAPRYAVYSSLLVAIALLLAASATRPWKASTSLFAVAAAALASLVLSWAIWPDARESSAKGRLLAEVVPVGAATASERYFGVLHPGEDWARRILTQAEARGLYAPPRVRVHEPVVRVARSLAAAPLAGHLDDVRVAGDDLIASGWSHLPATLPGRVMTLSSGSDVPIETSVVLKPRLDVATLTGDAELLFSGFELRARYASPGEAGRAAAVLCIGMEAPGHGAAILAREGGTCRADERRR